MPGDLFDPLPRFEALDALFEAMHALDDDPLAVHGTNMVICRGNPAAR